jgi:uncharacterized alkaline shock family protein YloU
MAQAAESIAVVEQASIPAREMVMVLGGETPNDSASWLLSDHGSTIIHHDVVAKIAGVAIREVEGVHALVPYGTSQKVSAFARRITGGVMRDLGVQVEVGRVQAAVDVRIVTEYGASIVEIAREIRATVREQIEGMTGLEVVEVNIEIVDLFFRNSDQNRSPSDRRQLE